VQQLQLIAHAEAEQLLKRVRDQLKLLHNLSGKQVLLPIRAALTGKSSGAHLTDILALLSVPELRERLQRAMLGAPTV